MAPNKDVTVVQSNTYRHDSTADLNTAEVAWHLMTHTNDTFPQSLTNSHLQAQHGNNLNCQQDKVWDQERTCKELKQE
jgi:hypothetical protein